MRHRRAAHGTNVHPTSRLQVEGGCSRTRLATCCHPQRDERLVCRSSQAGRRRGFGIPSLRRRRVLGRTTRLHLRPNHTRKTNTRGSPTSQASSAQAAARQGCLASRKSDRRMSAHGHMPPSRARTSSSWVELISESKQRRRPAARRGWSRTSPASSCRCRMSGWLKDVASPNASSMS